MRSLIKKAGRKRSNETEAERLHATLRAPQMHQLPLVEQAMGLQTATLLRRLETACTSADELAEAAPETFDQHPDAEIITSFPGLGSRTGARVLAEIGLVDGGADGLLVERGGGGDDHLAGLDDGLDGGDAVQRGYLL